MEIFHNFISAPHEFPTSSVIALKSIAGIALLKDEKPILNLRPVVFAFGKYYELAGLYFLAAITWTLANTYGGTAFTTAPWYYELPVYWLILVLPALVAGALWISKQPLVYTVIAGIIGTAVALWTQTTTTTVPSFLGFAATTLTPTNVLPLTLGTAAFIAFIFIQLYRR